MYVRVSDQQEFNHTRHSIRCVGRVWLSRSVETHLLCSIIMSVILTGTIISPFSLGIIEVNLVSLWNNFISHLVFLFLWFVNTIQPSRPAINKMNWKWWCGTIQNAIDGKESVEQWRFYAYVHHSFINSLEKSEKKDKVRKADKNIEVNYLGCLDAKVLMMSYDPKCGYELRSYVSLFILDVVANFTKLCVSYKTMYFVSTLLCIRKPDNMLFALVISFWFIDTQWRSLKHVFDTALFS